MSEVTDIRSNYDGYGMLSMPFLCPLQSPTNSSIALAYAPTCHSCFCYLPFCPDKCSGMQDH